MVEKHICLKAPTIKIANKLCTVLKKQGLYRPFVVGREVWALVGVTIPEPLVWTVVGLPGKEIMAQTGNSESIVYGEIDMRFRMWKKARGWG